MAATMQNRIASGLVQYGEMHKVIGQQQHQPRVRLSELTEKPNFYGVGALAGLKGEISVIDSRATVSMVNSNHAIEALGSEGTGPEATMLIGAYIKEWIEIPITEQLSDSDLDSLIKRRLRSLRGGPMEPTMFRVVGEFSNIDMHVINGACPVHARVRKLTLPARSKAA